MQTNKRKKAKSFRMTMCVLSDQGYGLPPKLLNDILGKNAYQTIIKDIPLSLEYIDI